MNACSRSRRMAQIAAALLKFARRSARRLSTRSRASACKPVRCIRPDSRNRLSTAISLSETSTSDSPSCALMSGRATHPTSWSSPCCRDADPCHDDTPRLQFGANSCKRYVILPISRSLVSSGSLFERPQPGRRKCWGGVTLGQRHAPCGAARNGTSPTTHDARRLAWSWLSTSPPGGRVAPNRLGHRGFE
jgi:hypothetical protein